MECLQNDGTCIFPRVKKIIDNKFGSVEEAKKKLSCDTESCILRRTYQEVSKEEQREIRENLLKHIMPPGPKTSKDWLSDVDIDGVLFRLYHRYSDFYNYEATTIDFAQHASYTINKYGICDLLGGNVNEAYAIVSRRIYGAPVKKESCKRFAIVFNTGPRYQGKHWVCCFVDTTQSPASIEYFNSSGKPPPDTFTHWMLAQKKQMEAAGIATEIVIVSKIRHQPPGTGECGVYCLFYIYSRLNGAQAKDYFFTPIPVEQMYAFRARCFTN